MDNIPNTQEGNDKKENKKKFSCKNCGNKLAYIVKYCPNCGEELK